MPINLIDYSDSEEDEKGTKLGKLCADIWEMPTQIRELEHWLFEHGSNLPIGDYIADVGYSPRKGACGGSAVLSPKAMKVMSEVGMSLFLSEYADE